MLNKQSCDNHVRQLIRRIDCGVVVGFCFCTALGCVSCRELRKDLAKYCYGSLLYSAPLPRRSREHDSMVLDCSFWFFFGVRVDAVACDATCAAISL